MREIVFEACLHDCFKWLLSQYESILVITVQIHLVNLLHFVFSLHLVSFKMCFYVSLFLLSLILALLDIFFGSSDEWIYFI